jgi:hypothetical protein
MRFNHLALLSLVACGVPDDVLQPAGEEPAGNGTGLTDGSTATVDAGGQARLPADGAKSCATVQCGTNAMCNVVTLQCECAPGFAKNGVNCVAIAPGDPRTHTQVEVCGQWTGGHTQSAGASWTAGPSQCDPGTLSTAAIADTLKRANMFRWMVGLGPVTENVAQRATYMAGAAVASWNPPGTVANPHFPPPDAKCYTAAGSQGTSTANLGWGNPTAADAMDQYMIDRGNEQTFGHRRWLMNPSLGKVGIGYYAGGGPYGSAQCLGVFDGSGSGPSPAWVSFPPPGFVPLETATWDWTFHGAGADRAQMQVRRKQDAANLAMQRMTLSGGYGSYDTIAFRPSGWRPSAGDTYEVTVSNLTAGTVTYEVKPVACN